MEQNKSVSEKALSLNLIRPLYGTIAEIGAGQEVARWFFQVGGAAGTIAKAMSAYDKAFSDSIYGKETCGRYVVESRLHKMLEHEFDLLETRLSDKDKKEKYFFAYANTLAAKSFKYTGDCHGWMGVRFQRTASEKPSQVIIHTRLLDKSNLQQQEAAGILGVNLIYAAFHHHNDIDAFLCSLLDGEIDSRIEVNLVRFEGPAFDGVEPIMANLQLLTSGLTQAVLFPFDKEPSHLSEELYEKQVICHRGEFSPPLMTDLDILISARNHYCGNKTEGECDPYLISEIYTDLSKSPSTADLKDIADRIQQLQKCKQNVLVTGFDWAYGLTEYIALFTDNHINLVYRSSRIVDILEKEEFNTLEPLARVFNDRTRVYIYPTASAKVAKEFHKNPKDPLFKLSDYKPSDKNEHLFKHLIQKGYLQDLPNYNKDYAHWDHEIFCAKRDKGEKGWESLVPQELR